MKRLAPLLLVVGLFGEVETARANDLGILTAMYGGTVSSQLDDRKWQPSLWIDVTYGAVGIFHVGAYIQWLGESWPLDNPGIGGGLALGLRGDIKKLRLTGLFNTGYLNVPVPTGKEGAWNISAIGGIGYGFLDWMGFEVRMRWVNYFKMGTLGAPNNAWSVEGGFSFFIKE